MTNSITNRQMIFILVSVLTTVAVINLPKNMAQSAGTGSWITLLIVSLIFALAAYLLVSLNNMFQGKVLFDYSKELVGKIGCWILSILYALYFFVVYISLNIHLVNLVKTNVLHETPLWASLFVSISVFGYIAYKGVTNAARIIEIFGLIFILIAVVVHIIMISEGKISHILPIFIPSEAMNYLSSIRSAVFAFLGIEVLTIIPFSEKNGKKAAKTAFLSVIGIGLFYILIVESGIMMIGINSIIHYNYPTIIANRLIQLHFLKILERIDILYLTVGFLGLFTGISIVYLSIVEYVCRMMPKVKRIIVTILVGVLAYILCIIIQRIKDIREILDNIITLSGIITAMLIPASLILIAKVKNHAKDKAI